MDSGATEDEKNQLEPSLVAGNELAPNVARHHHRSLHVKVPVDHLGRVLDHGLASVYAVRLLIEKHRHGPGYVLNQRHLAKKRVDGGIEMSRRGFKRGIHVLKSGPLRRWQGGRRPGGRGAFARESLVPSRRGYVMIHETALDLPFKTVAFIAAALLSPCPRSARNVAARIGVKGQTVIGRLVSQAFARNFIAAVKAKDGWVVARPGVDLNAFKVGERKVENGPVEKEAVETGPVETGPTHNRKEEEHREKRKGYSAKRVFAQEKETDSSPSLESIDGEGVHDPLGGREHAEEVIAFLRSIDHAEALARHLLTPRGVQPLLALMRQYGEVVRAAVADKLTSFAIDGADLGKVASWSYFHGAIDDERRRAWMQEHGLRPGDTGNRHRRAAL